MAERIYRPKGRSEATGASPTMNGSNEHCAYRILGIECRSQLESLRMEMRSTIGTGRENDVAFDRRHSDRRDGWTAPSECRGVDSRRADCLGWRCGRGAVAYAA